MNSEIVLVFRNFFIFIFASIIQDLLNNQPKKRFFPDFHENWYITFRVESSQVVPVLPNFFIFTFIFALKSQKSVKNELMFLLDLHEN